MELLPEDALAHRQWLLSFCTPPTAGTVVDLGCGRGHDLLLLATANPDGNLRLVGVDGSAASIATAAERCRGDSRIELLHQRLVERLPFPDASVDVLYSNNLLECLGDGAAFARDVARIVRPGGLLIVGHWDCDSQMFDGTDKDLVRRIVHAYADWQQDWMDHADGWMGRRLWGLFHSTQLFAGTAHARVLINTTYAPPWYGHARARDFSALVGRGVVPASDYARFIADLEALENEGRYFYGITGFAYVGRRLDERRSNAEGAGGPMNAETRRPPRR
jgi:SAM-dependent methyltransferase